MILKQSSTTRALLFFMVDSSSRPSGKTGLTPTVTLSKNGAAFGAVAGTVAEIGSGWYKVAGNATDTNTLGALALHATGAGADPCDKDFEVGLDDIADAVWNANKLVDSVAVAWAANSVGQMLGMRLDAIRANTAQAGAAGTITLDASASAVNNFYSGLLAYVYSGTGIGQVRRVTAYNGTTKVTTVTPNWATNPDNTSKFALLASSGLVTGFSSDADDELDAQIIASVPSVVQIDTQLSNTHGSGTWGAGTGGGAFAITVTVTDGTSPLQAASVRVTEGVTSTLLQTDASGNATFALDALTYDVVVTKDGYSFTPTTRTVTGAQAGTLVNNLVMALAAPIGSTAGLTANQLANVLLAHINKQIGDDLPPGCRNYIVHSFNATLETMRTKAPDLFKKNINVTFPGARTGTVTVTADSRSMTLGTLTAPDSGETIVIDGDSGHNEVYHLTSDGGTYKLVHPYRGTTGSHNATIYGDSVKLDTEVERVRGAQLLVDRSPLQVITSRTDWALLSGAVLGGTRGYGGSTVPSARRVTGTPEAVWLDVWVDPASTAIEYRLRCAPEPSGVFAVSIDVTIKVNSIVSADLDDSAARYFPVPGGRDQTILKPLALNAWLASPWFRPTPDVRESIKAEYLEAVAALDGGFRPDATAQGSAVVSGY